MAGWLCRLAHTRPRPLWQQQQWVSSSCTVRAEAGPGQQQHLVGSSCRMREEGPLKLQVLDWSCFAVRWTGSALVASGLMCGEVPHDSFFTLQALTP